MKVGIYIPNWIGDCVMALPFLAACKQKHQNDKIICIARQWVSPVLEKNSNIDELIIITKDCSIIWPVLTKGKKDHFKPISGATKPS